MILKLEPNKFNENPFWINPISSTPEIQDVSLFDTNGYDLCGLEQKYALVNLPASLHRYKMALKYEWISDAQNSYRNAHINHALLFERKGYAESAKEQLLQFAKEFPLCYKLLKINSKWGIDFAVDYCDELGNVFEVFHYEWDSFNYEDVCNIKHHLEKLIFNTDWDDAAAQLLRRRAEWDSLSFFEQSNWKCKYFGVAPEQFKVVIWNELP